MIFSEKSLAQIQGFWRAEVDIHKEEKCKIGVLGLAQYLKQPKEQFWEGCGDFLEALSTIT